jgi:hypothetical protein
MAVRASEVSPLLTMAPKAEVSHAAAILCMLRLAARCGLQGRAESWGAGRCGCQRRPAISIQGCSERAADSAGFRAANSASRTRILKRNISAYCSARLRSMPESSVLLEVICCICHPLRIDRCPLIVSQPRFVSGSEIALPASSAACTTILTKHRDGHKNQLTSG